MNDAAKVLCAGIIVVDHVAAPTDRLPDAGQLVLTDECKLSIGGCASNVAVDLAKMEIATRVAGCVGDDVFGRFARDFLDQPHIDTSALVTIKGVSTSQTLIVNVKGQDRRFIHHLGANARFSSQHLPPNRLEGVKILYVGGYFLLDAFMAADLANVFAAAKRAGVTTMLDVVTPGPKDYLGALRQVLPWTDFFLPNRDEAELMTGEPDPLGQAEIFRALGAGASVITCGAQGAVYLSETKRFRSGVFPVSFVDGTGGGDAFDAGFIVGLLENAPPERCVELGSALGASCVRQSGATNGVFTRAELDGFLAGNRLACEPF